MNEKSQNERSRYDKGVTEKKNVEEAKRDQQSKVNQERGGASNVPVAGELVSTAGHTTHPAKVNNPAPGDPDPIEAGKGPASPSTPTTSTPTGEKAPDGGYPSNPSLDPHRRHRL